MKNGNLVSGGGYGDNTIKILNKQDGSLIRALTGHKGSIYALKELPNGNLVSGDSTGAIRIWNTENGSLIRTIKVHTQPVSSFEVLPNGYFASASYDETIRFWN